MGTCVCMTESLLCSLETSTNIAKFLTCIANTKLKVQKKILKKNLKQKEEVTLFFSPVA